MIKRTILILSLLLGYLWQSQAQIMMLFSSDSLTNITSPLDIDSLFCWFAADVGVTDSLGGAIATDEGVGQWNDLSGNGHHVTPGSTAKPIYKATGGPGSKPTLQFNGLNTDYLVSSNHFWGSDYITVFGVIKWNDAGRDAAEYLCQKTGSGDTRQWRVLGNNNVNGNDITLQIFQSGTLASSRVARDSDKRSAWTLVSVTHNGTSSGTSIFLDASSRSISYSGTGDGTIYNTSSAQLLIGQVLLGSISEIIVFSRALTTAERTAIENYLNKKYDLY